MSPLLYLHIGGGAVGLLSGALAMAAPKGGRIHRASGDIYVVAMCVMGAGAAWLASSLPDWKNLPGGLFAPYLAVTGWATVARRSALSRLGERVGLVLGGAALTSALVLAMQGRENAGGLFVIAAMTTLSLALDLRALRPADVRPARDVARHIWRMCAALFIATGSFFLGQQKVMPTWMQGSPVLPVLAIAPLPIMAFWLARTALRGARRADHATA